MKSNGLKILQKDQLYFMCNLVFHTIRELKLSVRVLVFFVLNVSELICGLTRSRTL